MKVALALVFALISAAMAAKTCHVFPTTGKGPSTSLDCTSIPGHSAEHSGCFYRKYTDDSDVKSGDIEGGCGGQMCRGDQENCRFLMESEDGAMATSNFCCCYGDDCNTVAKAEKVGGDAMF